MKQQARRARRRHRSKRSSRILRCQELVSQLEQVKTLPPIEMLMPRGMGQVNIAPFVMLFLMNHIRREIASI